jgi:hypothetical protein
MRTPHSLVALTAALLAATVSSSPVEDIFGRAVGDKCTAKEGSGSCQNTSKCQEAPPTPAQRNRLTN